MAFRDRAEAGRRLTLAAMLQVPLDLVLLARKLGAPFQPEPAMGAVADSGSPVVVRNENVIAISSAANRNSGSGVSLKFEAVAKLASSRRPVVCLPESRSGMAWISIIRDGRVVLTQTVPPSENLYDFAWRFVQRERRAGTPQSYQIDDGHGAPFVATEDQIRGIQYMLGGSDAHQP